MSYYSQTMDNIKAYLLEAGYHTYEKMEGSSSSGFLYNIPCAHGQLLCNVRVEKNTDTVILEVYPGISVLEPYFAMTAAHCQRCHLPLGSLQMNRKRGELYYHIETLFQDAPTSGKVLASMEQMATAVLDKQYDVLSNLSHGVIPTLDSLNDAATPLPNHDIHTASPHFAASIASVKDHLCNMSNHNIISRNLDIEDPIAFCCEVLTSSARYMLEFHFDCEREFMTLRAYPGGYGIQVPVYYHTMVSQLCMEFSDEKKIGYLHVGHDEKGLCAYVSTSFADAPISGESVEFLERIVVSMVSHHGKDLEMVSHGRLLSKGFSSDDDDDDDDDDRSMGGLLDRLRSRLPFASDDDDDDDDDDDGLSGFRAFLEAHRAQEDSDDDDDDDDDDDNGLEDDEEA